ncbi:MAG: glutamate--tRNA ligase [Bacteroidales bacterium]
MVRVRFAPSPTGPLHIGGVRTALYNYLFARKHGGTFILRIEDTDQGRYVEGAEEYIMESLEWCGIKVDEGIREGGPFAPYRQSDRKSLYREYAEKLVTTGFAYYAFDTPDDLEKLRTEHEKRGATFIYNATNREGLSNSLSLPEEVWKEKIARDEPHVVRFRMPLNEEIHCDDLIRGHIVVNSDTLDDKVLFKTDGMPTYHLANIVDDRLMEITHVIRGEEWLPSLPLHFMIYRAFGWTPPLFAHLPLLLKPDGKGKLSKRDGDKMGFPVFPLYWPYGETARGYREDGYYPEAFINMLALLGWNPGTEQEIFDIDELAQAFTIERVHKAGSRFDPEKAKWFNHQYLQMKTDTQLAMEFRELLRAKGFHYDIGDLEELVRMVKERVSFVKQLWDETDFFFVAPESYDNEVVRKRWKDETPSQLAVVAALIGSIDEFTKEKAETEVKSLIEAKAYNTGAIMNALRLAIVGASRGPHLFDIIGWIGKEETLKRITRAIEVIGK